jgi:microcystin-dependent protein
VGTRIKTFVSTGIAPDGRLFAGDLNAMEDQYADLANLAQTLAVGTIQVGETGLQIIRYGAGEMRISGHLRTDGIFRALGGLYAGSYTTVQRDAISAGSRPYGLVILNTNTNRLEINIGSDAVPSWTGLSAAISRGILGSRPGPAASNSGSWYFATDDNGGTLYYSDGSVWTKVARGLTQALDAGSVGTTQLVDASVTTAKHADGSVTLQKLDSGVPVIPLGGMIDWPWASGSIPAWAALPYGQLLTQASFPGMQSLADAAGRPYGGVAGTNFNLPDMRGRAAIGKDDMGGTAANRITAAISGVAGTVLGGVFGAEGITLTTGQLPAHNHGITGAPGISDPTHNHGGVTGSENQNHSHGVTDPGHGHTLGDDRGTVNVIWGNNGSSNYGTTIDDSQAGLNYGFARAIAAATGISLGLQNAAHNHNIPGGGTGITVSVGTLGTANAGSGSAHQNTQPSIIVNKLMRVL